jgi:hypothetical protein
VNIKKIPHEEYLELFNKLKSVMRMPDMKLDPYMTKEERLKAIEEALNPPLPLYIDWYEVEGLVRYVSDELKTSL